MKGRAYRSYLTRETPAIVNTMTHYPVQRYFREVESYSLLCTQSLAYDLTFSVVKVVKYNKLREPTDDAKLDLLNRQCNKVKAMIA
ncbi:hypothetical protein KQX54_010917 [Cotesia glomerata]|uniref:Uncharacterized protein n=1 Tax=Cotesia glomerata TaxID=32391 RepID=A0AAV7J3U7_COTGL|nr:hypothetical protein KQX54_010917 [Cotesia glomerata]